MLVFITIIANISPNTIPSLPTPELGYFDNGMFDGLSVYQQD